TKGPRVGPGPYRCSWRVLGALRWGLGHLAPQVPLDGPTKRHLPSPDRSGSVFIPSRENALQQPAVARKALVAPHPVGAWGELDALGQQLLENRLRDLLVVVPEEPAPVGGPVNLDLVVLALPRHRARVI